MSEPSPKAIVKFNCKAAKTVLDSVVRNIESGATASQYTNIKNVVELLNEALKEA